MRVVFPRFTGDESAIDLARKIRDVIAVLQKSLQQVRIDGPLIIGGGQTIDKHFMFSKTWDPGNVNNGAQATTTVTATGVVLADADLVTVGFSNDLQGMQLTGYVSANDVVTVVLRNGTGGALDLASGTLRVGVTRY